MAFLEAGVPGRGRRDLVVALAPRTAMVASADRATGQKNWLWLEGTDALRGGGIR
jgi:hypothetical protein